MKVCSVRKQAREKARMAYLSIGEKYAVPPAERIFTTPPPPPPTVSFASPPAATTPRVAPTPMVLRPADAAGESSDEERGTSLLQLVKRQRPLKRKRGRPTGIAKAIPTGGAPPSQEDPLAVLPVDEDMADCITVKETLVGSKHADSNE